MTMHNLMMNLLLRRPFYGYILSSLKLKKSSQVKDFDLIPGPVVTLLYNPQWLEEQSEGVALGALIHQLLHLVLLHPLRRSQRKREYWYLACDLAVNEHISTSLLPESYLTVERLNREIRPPLEKKRMAEYYYDRLISLPEEQGLNLMWREGQVMLKLPSQEDIAVSPIEEGDPSEINSQALKHRMEQVIQRASIEGEIPGTLGGDVEGLYRSAQVNWKNVLRKYLTGKGKSYTRKTVKRVSKRYDDMPGSKRYKGLQVLVAVDESGSIANEDVRNFCMELKSLKEKVRGEFRVTRFDSSCSSPITLDAYLKTPTRMKRGGTDFRPIFHLADSLKESLVLIFTDGQGYFPEQVKQKVLWIKVGEDPVNFPFGEVIPFSS